MPEAKLSNPHLQDLLQKGLTALAESESEVSPARVAYRKAACVLAAFDPARLQPYDAPPEAGDGRLHLLEDCTVLHSRRRGASLWMLKPEVRREALRALHAEKGFERALRANTQKPVETRTLQRMFEQYLRAASPDEYPPVEAMSGEEMQAALVVIQWLEEAAPTPPALAEQIRRRLNRRQLLSQFEHLTADGFAGRKIELDDLRNHVGVKKAETYVGSFRRMMLGFFRPASRAPLVLWGPGGVGKSTLVAQFLLEHATLGEEVQFPYAYLDFDNGVIGAERSAPLVNEILRQLQLQYPDQSARIERFRRLTRGLSKGSEGCAAAPKKHAKGGRAKKTRRREDERVIRALARLVKLTIKAAHGDSLRPFLVVLDTFENVQRVGEARVKQLWAQLDSLRRHLPNARIVATGRDELKVDGLPGPRPHVVPLDKLDREAADAVLKKQGVDDASKYEAIYRQTGGNPLSLRLAAASYRQGSLDTSFTATIKAHLLRQLPSGESFVQGQLYDRILGNIPEENVRRLANPGLALRLISVPVIMDVLREPCGIDITTPAEAEELLGKLEKASLVEREGDALRHRADVRRVMLGPLDHDKPGLVQQINKRAVEFYEKQQGLTARAEEIYHRLRLGQEHELIAARWEPGVEDTLRGAMDELPIRSQVFLASRLKAELTPEQQERLTPHEWEQVAANKARDLLAYGLVEDARRLLAERAERTPNSPLYMIEAELAIAANRLPLAQEKLDQAQKAARDAGDMPALLRAVQRAAEVAKQADNPVLADQLAARAADLAVVVDDPLMRLRALLLQLHVQPRLTRADRSTAIKAQVAESFKMVLQRQLWESARALVRRAAHALAGDFPDLFFEAFRIAGFGQLTMKDVRLTVSSLRKWAKEKGYDASLLSLIAGRGLQPPDAAAQVADGGAVRQQPSYSADQLSAVVEELLVEARDDAGLQKIIAEALGDSAEQES